jgi:superfamily II DNA or RNA helicase
MATGTGKTITGAMCFATTPKEDRILWVAHRKELINQAKDALAEIMPNRTISIEKGEQKANPDSDIIVGSVQTLARQRKHLEGFYPKYVFIDEAHHWSKNNIQYQSLFDRFPKAKFVLATATPYRANGEILPLGQTLIQMDLGTAVERGYLVPLKPEILISDVSLENVKTSMGDFAIADLSKAVNVETRNKLIAARAIELIKQGRQGILFGVDVAHSKAMCAMLSESVRTGEIYGDTPDEERAEVIEKFKRKEIDIICNNTVLTEGTDLPNISFVIVARPTKSLGLYSQIIGRGARLAKDKIDCIIVDVYDKIKLKQTRVGFKDFASNVDLNGDKRRVRNILETALDKDAISQELKNFPIFVKQNKLDRWGVDEEFLSIGSWMINDHQWIVAWSAEVSEAKIIHKPVSTTVDKLLGGQDLIGKLVAHAKFGIGTIRSIEDKKVKVNFNNGGLRIIEAHFLGINKIVKEFSPDEIEKKKIERLYYICLPYPTEPGRIVSCIRQGRKLIVQEDQQLSKYELEGYLCREAMRDGILQLIRVGARWKNGPASDKQKEFVAKMIDGGKIGFDLDLESLTKGEASAIIEQMKWQDLIIEKFGTDDKRNLLGYDKTTEDV